MSWRPRSLRLWLSLNRVRGRGRDRRNRTLLSPTTPRLPPPSRRVPGPRTGPPGARGWEATLPPPRHHNSAGGQDPSCFCLPGQSFGIEHRVWEKKTKYRPLLGAAVDDPKRRFVPFVLEASGRLGPEAGAFLECLQSIFSFPILRFRALVGVLFAKHNAQMALRWVRFLRHPI